MSKINLINIHKTYTRSLHVYGHVHIMSKWTESTCNIAQMMLIRYRFLLKDLAIATRTCMNKHRGGNANIHVTVTINEPRYEKIGFLHLRK